MGILDDWEKSATIAFQAEGDEIFRIGQPTADLGQSLWLRELHGLQDGPPPIVDLQAERKAGRLIREMVSNGEVTAVHDLSDGGLLVAATEMALASRMGCSINIEGDPTSFLFAEHQGCFLVTIANDGHDFIERVMNEGILASHVGTVLGLDVPDLMIIGGPTIPLADLRAAHEGFFPALMGTDAALA